MSESLESLKNEIYTYITMLEELKQAQNRGDNESFAYIIDKSWLKDWKLYINYNFIKKTKNFSHYYENFMNKKYELTGAPLPNPITNQKLLYDLKEFYNDGDLENQENLVIRHNIDQIKEVKIVNEKIWKFFNKKYGGGPMLAKKILNDEKNQSNPKIVELYYRKVLIIFKLGQYYIITN